MTALHYGKHIEGKRPSEVLQEVRDALAEYKTGVRKNGQAVTLYYETWPNVDIVPASRVVNDAGRIASYSIPDMNTETWLTSKPKTHSSNMTKKNTASDGAFKRIIKMIVIGRFETGQCGSLHNQPLVRITSAPYHSFPLFCKPCV